MIVIISPYYVTRQGIRAVLSEIDKSLTIREFEDLKGLTVFCEDNPVKACFIDSLLISNTPGHELISTLKSISISKVAFGFGMKTISDSIFDHYISLAESKKELINSFSAFLINNNSDDTTSGDISDREKEILKQVALGLTNKEIADKLYLSIHTVITHRKNITRKLGIKTVSGLTVYAILNQLVDMKDVE